MPTVFMNMISLGATRHWALFVHGTVCVLAFVVMWRTVVSTRDRFAQFAVTMVATFVITPYVMCYDTLILGWVMMMLAERVEVNRWQWLVYMLVASICPLGLALTKMSLGGAPLALLGLFGWVSSYAMGQTRGEEHR
jgi:hypothetical protein